MREIIVSGGWRDRLEALVGRRRESWALVVLILVVAGGGLLLWSRASSPQIAPPATSSPAVPAPVPSPSPSAEVILVHVAGAVRRPGLYELTTGARVADAVAAAGGPTRRADLDLLNLAEAVVDGQKVEVPTPATNVAASATAPLPAPSSPAPTGTTAGVININTADQAALESVPEVGPVTAQAILEYREQIGSFESVEQLLEVSGIGPATLEAMRPFVTV